MFTYEHFSIRIAMKLKQKTLSKDIQKAFFYEFEVKYLTKNNFVLFVN